MGAAAFLALFALLLTTSGSPSPAHAQASPSVAISLSDTSVERGTAITATMSFSNLASDSDTSTTDYVFRADVVDADGCEGGGMGKDRHFYQVDEDTETREATVSASCPAGAYTVRASLSSAEGEELSSATADFSVAAPPDPSVSVELAPSDFVEEGNEITATMSFSNLASDSDTSTTDYVFRADVVDADGCEGGGMGKDRHFYQVDEDTETREATVSASCPAGAYTVRASLSSAEGEELSSATADFSVAAPPDPSVSVAAPPDPSVSVELAPSDFVEEGNEITATMSFGGLASDSDTSTIDYVFRADALDSEDEAADDCEGNGLGADRNINQVDDDPETRTGTISAECPAGSYTLRVSISSADDTELASASAGFFILRAPEPVEPPTLTALSVSHGDPAVDVTLSPAFDSATLAYRATVRVAQVTVAPTASDADATVAYRDGNGDAIADAGADGQQVDLDAGSNTVRVAVSKDSLTTTYTISLFRLVTQQQQQDDATLSALTLSDGTLRPAFDAATTEYRAAVKHNVEQITVTPAAASGATVEYLDRTGGAFADADSATGHQVDLAVSETEFKVRVNNGSATETYTVTMERDSARVFGWTPSRDINAAAAAGNTNAVGMWGDATTLYVSDSADAKLYAYTKATGARDADKDISLHSENENPTGIWSDGTTLWVADDTDVKLYAYTLAGGTRVSETSGGTTTYPKDVDLHNSNDGPSALWGNATHIYVAENSENGPVSGPFRNLYAYRLTSGATYGDRDTDKEFKLFGANGRTTGLWSDGTTLWATDTQFSEVLAYTLADKTGNLNKGFYLRSRSSGDAGAAAIWSDGKTVWIKENIADGKLYSYNMLPTTAGDTTLSALTATYGSNTAAALRPAFAFGELFYRTAVPNSAAQVTITPTPNMSGSTLSVLPADADSGTSGHQVDVRVGTTVIDIKVTASNGDALTYRVVLERDSPLIQGWTPTKDINGLFEAGNTKANGLWSDGTTVWVGDYDQNKLYAYTLATGARAAGSDISINAISRHQAKSLWSNGTTIWVAGHGGQKIFAYTLAGGAQDSGNDIPLDHIPNSDRSGIWSDGTTMWVVDATDDKVYAYAMSDGKRQDGTDGTTNKEFDLDALNSTAGGLWSNGTTMWVSDLRLNGNKLYAYTLASGTRDSANDILLYAGNARPTGLWANSDGTTIWVADDSASRQKVYSYNMAPATAGDTTLTTLTVSDSTLRPAFTFGTGTYRAAVPNSAAQVTVTPTANNPGSSTITIDGEAATSGSGYSVNASVGVTMVEIKVTSSGNSLTYSLVVERDSAEDWGWTPTKDINSLTAGDARIWGIWANATTFYIAHDLGSTIYAYNLSDGSRDADKDITLDALNQNSRGIWSNGTTLWAVDYVDKKLYAYKLSPAADYGDRDSGKDINLDLPNDYGAVDVWSNDTIIWVSDYVADKLYAYTLATGVRDADKDINLDPANTLATGIWSDDTIIWVSDHVADKLYAYALNGGARDTSQEFALPSSNGGPRALWADGTSMWMLASVGKKVFSYTMPAQTVAPPSTNDATLSGLTLSAGTLRPPFATTTKSYRAAVEHSVEQVTVTPAANAASASIEYLDGSDMALTDADTVAAGHQVAVAVELTTFQVKVTDGTATETYTVTMERDSDQPGGWTPTRDINTARAAGNDFTRGVWGNATTLYVADSNDNKVYAYTRSDGTRNSASEFALDSDNGAARGIWSNGTTLWVADESDVKVYAYTLGTKARDTASEFALDSANDDARGIWSDGTTLWVADDDGAKVYAYTLDTKARDTASEFALHQFNTDAWGIWSDRTTLWVADVDGRVYAYTLAGGARNTAKEFSLHSENTGPDGSAAGIWSDRTTMWVADLFNDKIYTYIATALAAPLDTTGPTVAITLGAGVSEPLNGGASSITFTFSEAIDPATFTASDITVKAQGTSDDAGTVTEPAADAGATPANSVFTVDLTPTANTEGSLVVGLAADAVLDGDSNGNTAQSATFAFDAVKPTLSSKHFTGRTVTLTFSEPLDESSVPSLTVSPRVFDVSFPTLQNMQFTTIAVSGPTVTLTQPSAAVPQNVLEINYYKPDDNPLRDLAGNAVETFEGVTLQATTSNAVPVFPSGTITRSVAENTGSGQNVGAPVAATDADTGDTLTYSLEGTDSGSFGIVSASGQIQTSAALNYEAKSSYSVTVKVNDGTVNATKAVTISVTDVAEPPDRPAAPIVSAKSGTTDSLDVRWTAPASTGRPAIDDYNVRYRIGTTGSFTSHSFSGTGRFTTIAGLNAGTSYQVQVQARNPEGDSAWSASGTARTNASTSAVSNDATLSAVTLSPTDISNFRSGTLTYSVDVANPVDSVTVTPTANHASATITVNGATVASGSGRAVSVDVGSNTITIVVTAEDGNTTESYTVTVTRAASGAYDGTPQLAGANAAPWGIWGNADTLWVSDQADKKLYAYRRSDGSRVAARDIDIGGELTGASRRTYGIWSDGTRMWVADASAGALLAYGVSDGARQEGRDVALAEDANDYANDHDQPRGVGSDGTTLWVADLRTGALHDKLYAYGVSNGVRRSGDEFDLAKSTEYANTSDNSNPAGVWTDGTTLWVADDYDAKIYAYAVSGGARVSEVSGGSTVYPKDVTLDAENDTPAGIWSDGVRLWVVDRVVGKLYTYDLPGAVASDDVTLSALTLSGVTLSPSFASGTYGYTASVANSVESTTVTATPTHAGASREITPADTDANAAGHQVNLTAGGDTVITVEVTAQDKMTTKTYRATVTRAAAQPPQSDDATLSALSLSGVSLSPAFASRTIRYTPSVANSVESTTVTASTNQASATVVIMPADADANTAGHQVNLGVGDTEITVEVTAEDGSAMKTYTVTVTRAPAGASSDATLRELTLSGVTLTQAFTPEVITYTANVDNSVSATTVKAVTTDARATRKILIGGVQDLDADVDLAVGDNTITVEVTAEDGVTTKTYTVTVTRAAPPAAAGVPNIVVAASKRVFNPADGSDDGGYQERDLIIALYNLESDATWSGDNYYGDPSTLDYVHRTDILDAGGSTALADLDNRNDCEGPALMSVDREIRKVNENPETRDGGVVDTGNCVNDFAVTVTVWTGAAYESEEGRKAAPVAQLTCRFDGVDSASDDFRALPWGGEHEGPGWYYHEYVLCTDANGDLAPDSTPTIPALNWEPPEDS